MALVTLPTLPLASPPFPELASLSSRRAFPTDIRGEWTLAFSQNETLCPRSIQHLGWDRYLDGPFRVSHGRIIEDGVTCDNLSDGVDQKFRFYYGSAVRAAIKNDTNTTIPVPDFLLNILQSTGPNIDARYAANALKEEYLVGFEAADRVCHGQTLFRRGTTAFLIRPFRRAVRIKRIDLPLTVGMKWLVMVPLYKRISCVYNSKLNSELDDEDSPSPIPSLESGSENELGASAEGSSCFPSDALVKLRDGRHIPMSQLAVNDQVQVGSDRYSSVITFTHNHPTVLTTFRRIELKSGHVLRVSPGHFVYANGKLITASSVAVGDEMLLEDGTPIPVVTVSAVFGTGLYNPQTADGNIVVQGVRVSTYTTTIKPSTAHGLLTPLRALHRLFSVDISMGVFASNPPRSILMSWQHMISP